MLRDFLPGLVPDVRWANRRRSIGLSCWADFHALVFVNGMRADPLKTSSMEMAHTVDWATSLTNLQIHSLKVKPITLITLKMKDIILYH